MSKMEIYSILVTLNMEKPTWSLDGYKHHSLAGSSSCFTCSMKVLGDGCSPYLA